ncbi:MAG: hemolysin III family protein [Bradymonadaceae bacterium]|nr:hemolysin III family protein [Lujinxingiaceae bacterium]
MKSKDARAADRVKPKFRGSQHYAGFFAALGAGAMLVAVAPTLYAMLAALIYTFSLANLLGTSALYHRPMWSPTKRALLRKIDHAAIYILIAGTITPVCLLAMEGTTATALLLTAWIGAALGIAKEFIWPKAPKFVTAIIFVALGWVGATAMPALYATTGLSGALLFGAGGVAYTIGAVVYAFRRPDPWPASFGYHEIFHLLVIIAGMLHFLAVAKLVLP